MRFLNFGSRQSPAEKAQKDMAIEQFAGYQGAAIVADSKQSYIIQEKLGTGGFADVYRVTNTKKEVFALKILRMWTIMPEDRGEILHRFDREYICSRIDSSYLVRSYDKGVHLGNPFFVMDYCANGSLNDLIGQKLDDAQITKFAVNILKGLRDLHQEGIIHRDLKPVNILFNSQNEAQLTDFGISGYLKSRITVRNWMGHVKKIFGTVVYMPPEQLNAKEAFLSLGPVTDIFAFGITLHEVVSGGKLPFGDYDDSKDEEYLNRLTTGNYFELNKLKKNTNKIFTDIIEGCIQFNPLDRFQSAEAILGLLDTGDKGKGNRPVFNSKEGHMILKIMQGEEHGKKYDLDEMIRKKKSDVLTLGWYDPANPTSNDIAVVENVTKFISRFHATLEYIRDSQQWFIRDGQWLTKGDKTDWFLSTNGVLVNSKRISEEGHQIKVGDIITIGDTTLRMELI